MHYSLIHLSDLIIKSELPALGFVSFLFIEFVFIFPPTDSYSGERRGSDIQPQPGRQHQQIPRHHLSHPQGKTLEHTERCSSAPGRDGKSRSEPWLSNEVFCSRVDNDCTHLTCSLCRSSPLSPIDSLICLLSFCPPASVWNPSSKFIYSFVRPHPSLSSRFPSVTKRYHRPFNFFCTQKGWNLDNLPWNCVSRTHSKKTLAV